MILDFSPEAVNAYDNGQLEGTALGNKIDKSISEELLNEKLQQEYWSGQTE